MASKLSELAEYMKSTSNIIQSKLNDMHYQTDGSVMIDGDTYDISYAAMASLAKMVGVPPAYAKRIPSDLRSVNIEYFASRMDTLVSVTITDDIISEVKNADQDRTIGDIFDQTIAVFGDCYVVQADINQKDISFYLYVDEPVNVGNDELKRGWYVNCPIWKGGDCICSPALINDIDETCIEFSVYDQFLMTHEKDMLQDFSSVLEFGKEKARSVIDEATVNADNELSDINHFLSHEAKAAGVNSSNRRKVDEEAQNAGVEHVSDIVNAILLAEERTNNMKQVHNLAHLAGMAFYASDPRYCASCHQEIES